VNAAAASQLSLFSSWSPSRSWSWSWSTATATKTPPALYRRPRLHYVPPVFTGLVEATGTLARRDPRGDGARIAIRCTLGATDPLVMGESISVDGCCLSVVAMTAHEFEVDTSSETLARTTLGALDVGARVNLERATKLGQRMGGHIVSGHVDGVATVVERRPLGEAVAFAFEVPAPLARYIAEKGSITVGGVSLTVNAVAGRRFEVAVIPITRTETNFDLLAAGAHVNIEVDLLARYVARLIESAADGGAEASDARWMDLLRRGGYV
jgi:riboflavin synthase